MGDELDLSWSGPYSWLDFEATNGLPALPAFGGVYLQTAEYGGGYLMYCAGVTSRPFARGSSSRENAIWPANTLFSTLRRNRCRGRRLFAQKPANDESLAPDTGGNDVAVGLDDDSA